MNKHAATSLAAVVLWLVESDLQISVIVHCCCRFVHWHTLKLIKEPPPRSIPNMWSRFQATQSTLFNGLDYFSSDNFTCLNNPPHQAWEMTSCFDHPLGMFQLLLSKSWKLGISQIYIIESKKIQKIPRIFLIFNRQTIFVCLLSTPRRTDLYSGGCHNKTIGQGNNLQGGLRIN